MAFSTAAGGKLSMPSPSAVQRAMSRFSSQPEDPQTPQQSQQPTQPQPQPQQTQQSQPSTPLPPSFPFPRPSPSLPSTPVRKIGLGASPGGLRAQSTSRPKFITPFKNGTRPPQSNSNSNNNDSPRRALSPLCLNTSSPRKKAKVSSSLSSPIIKKKPCAFDLKSFNKQSHESLLGFGLAPGEYTVQDLLNEGLPDELVYFNQLNSSKTSLGNEEAIDEYKQKLCYQDKCNLIDTRWIRNHVELILWKFAGYCHSKPNQWQEFWSRQVVFNQLKYRYEREINKNQRSVIKRIQEHDTSASVPMVLCVCGIIIMDEQNEERVIKTDLNSDSILGVELTDGWYKIQCAIDNVLKKALQTKKLVLGSKLSITGARLDEKGNEGTEVLDAYPRSKLMLCSNYTSLTRWDARLGRYQGPFVSTLRSLSPEGGFIPVMDLIVKKIYPIFYVALKDEHDQPESTTSLNNTLTEFGPWTEVEEIKKQEQWKKKLQETQERIVGKHQQALESLSSLAEQMSNLAKSKGVPSDFVSSQGVWDGLSADDVCDKYESANQTVRQNELPILDGELLREASRVARERVSELSENANIEIPNEISKQCPPRRVRSMRIYRVEDYATTKRATRDAQLTVWDVSQDTEDQLQVGKRYMISNLFPTKPKYWTDLQSERRNESCSNTKPGEVFIQTCTKTRWRAMKQ